MTEEVTARGKEVRFLVNAFVENRAGEHVSSDTMWVEGVDGKKKQDFARRKLREIASAQGVTNLLGWAACRAEDVRKCHAVEDVVRTPQSDNLRHADIRKPEFLMFEDSDEKKAKQQKVQLVAMALRDCFNNNVNWFPFVDNEATAPSMPAASGDPPSSFADHPPSSDLE